MYKQWKFKQAAICNLIVIKLHIVACLNFFVMASLELKDKSSDHLLDCPIGITQGFFLGMILLNLYINDLPVTCIDVHVKCKQATQLFYTSRKCP